MSNRREVDGSPQDSRNHEGTRHFGLCAEQGHRLVIPARTDCREMVECSGGCTLRRSTNCARSFTCNRESCWCGCRTGRNRNSVRGTGGVRLRRPPGPANQSARDRQSGGACRAHPSCRCARRWRGHRRPAARPERRSVRTRDTAPTKPATSSATRMFSPCTASSPRSNAGGDDRHPHGPRIEDLEARATTDPKRRDEACRRPHMRPDVIDVAGEVEAGEAANSARSASVTRPTHSTGAAMPALRICGRMSAANHSRPSRLGNQVVPPTKTQPSAAPLPEGVKNSVSTPLGMMAKRAEGASS